MTDQNIAFMGKITAGMTHEIRNVLAIIRESSGLVQDLVGLSGEDFKHKDKIVRALENVQTQVARGTEISTRLNRFAHSMDEQVASIELFEFLKYISKLMERFARLKKVGVEVIPSEKSKSHTTNPFLVQMILCRSVEYILSFAGDGDVIVLQGLDTERGTAVQIAINQDGVLDQLPVDSILPDGLTGLTGALEIIKAQLFISSDPEKPKVMLVL